MQLNRSCNSKIKLVVFSALLHFTQLLECLLLASEYDFFIIKTINCPDNSIFPSVVTVYLYDIAKVGHYLFSEMFLNGMKLIWNLIKSSLLQTRYHLLSQCADVHFNPSPNLIGSTFHLLPAESRPIQLLVMSLYSSTTRPSLNA